jgi:ectoine hydroxylase-related dioxygenase (phytanoyl-CoA dioxygenase family)
VSSKLRRWLRAPITAKRFRALYFADKPVDFYEINEFRNEAFPSSGPACWLDRPDALIEVERRRRVGTLDAQLAEMCTKWIFDGYFIVPGLIGHDELDVAWSAYERAIADGRVIVHPEPVGPEDQYPGRNLDPHLKVPEICALQHHPRILAITDLLLGRRTLPFQTIMGHKGSSQRPHSDNIHMTTYPLGYLVANWIAFEDIQENSGPLEYYPRSHRMIPPLLSDEISIEPLEYKRVGAAAYSTKYEPEVERHIAAAGLKPEYFLGKAGDVLFWHANLIHGGAARKDISLSRKALVCHYFAEGAVTYHDLSGNPTRLHRNGMYDPPVVDE